MKIEDHLRNIRESLEVLEESISRGLIERQRNIALNASLASVEMLEVFLHQSNLLNPSSILKHEWFSSNRRAIEKLPFEFSRKNEIITLLSTIETKRNILCYGKIQSAEEIKSFLEKFNKLKSIFKELGLKWN